MIPNNVVPLKINSNSDELQKQDAHLAKAIEYLSFLRTTLRTGRATQSDVETQIGLTMTEIESMGKALELDEIQEKTKAWHNTTLKDMSAELLLLKKEIGTNLNAEQISAGIHAMLHKFEDWYEWAGFHYARLDIGERGITADFSGEIYPMDNDDEPPTETIFGPNSDYRFVLLESPYHSEIKDCDQNRTELRRLFKHYFPNARIQRFEAIRSDFPNEFQLRFKVFVPLKDVQAARFQK